MRECIARPRGRLHLIYGKNGPAVRSKPSAPRLAHGTACVGAGAEPARAVVHAARRVAIPQDPAPALPAVVLNAHAVPGPWGGRLSHGSPPDPPRAPRAHMRGMGSWSRSHARIRQREAFRNASVPCAAHRATRGTAVGRSGARQHRHAPAPAPASRPDPVPRICRHGTHARSR